MKIERKQAEPVFVPVVITLETKGEFFALLYACKEYAPGGSAAAKSNYETLNKFSSEI